MNRDTKIYQGPEGLALCLVPAEDLDQGPTGPEGEGIRLLMTVVYSHLHELHG